MTQNALKPSRKSKSIILLAVVGVLILASIVVFFVFQSFQETSLKTSCVVNHPNAKDPAQSCQEYIDKIKANGYYSQCKKEFNILNPMSTAVEDCLNHKGQSWNIVQDWTSIYQIAELNGHTAPVASVSFSPDGNTIASGAFDNTVKLWDVASGTELRTLTGHTDLVWSVAFSPDGKMLASGSNDGAIILWDVSTGNEIRNFKLNGAIHNLAFSEDGKLMASGESAVGLWDIATGNNLNSGFILAINRIPLDNNYGVFFSKNGKRAAVFLNDLTLRILDVASGSDVQTLQLTINSGRLLFSPDGNYLAVAENNGDTHTIQLWDVASGEKLYEVNGSETHINDLAFSPDGKILISGAATNDMNFIVWDVASGTQLNTLTRPDYNDPVSMDISPDGKILAFDNNFSIDLWLLP